MVSSFANTAWRRAISSRVAPIVAAAALSLCAPGLAWSHAHLKSAVPAVDSTVRTAPERVSVDFTERLEPKLSRLTVTDASGNRVDKDDAAVATADGKQLSVGLKPLSPGSYTVQWEITSVDTHRTEGRFTFIIKP
jgi:methionine-rich copper-binding protein CopC